ncbi:cytochrome P450 [Pseudonocardia ailaonensis]|uniref:Cytochrome P450 n=1 Tax=Pseudonocardia ailaonensis TaxID=367279 RepID=A0ABN2N471_9PSEU
MTPGTSTSERIDALLRGDPDAVADPYPLYRDLRDLGPAVRHKDVVLVSRFDSAKRVLTLPTTLQGFTSLDGKRFIEATSGADEERVRLLTEFCSFYDLRVGATNGQRHRDLRRIAVTALTPKAVSDLTERVRVIVAELLDEVDGDAGFDVIPSLAYQLPLIVICELLNIEADKSLIRQCAEDIAAFFGSDWRTTESLYDAHRSLFALRAYIVRSLESADQERNSPLMARMRAAHESSEFPFTYEDLAATATQFVFAGHETTTNQLANGLLELLGDWRSEWDALVADDSLLPQCIEELLRFTPSVQMLQKRAGFDGELEGVRVEHTDTVMIIYASANRDERVFDDPDRLDITRKASNHLGFGAGAHYCLGASLTRLELQTAFQALRTRFPKLELADQDLRWRPNYMLRGLEGLWVRQPTEAVA